MSTIFHQRPLDRHCVGDDGLCLGYTFSKNGEPVAMKCTFCGDKQATAFWWGCKTPDGNVFCCRECAVKVLPRLAADALVGESLNVGTRSNILHCLDKMQIEFWQAVVAAIHGITVAEAGAKAKDEIPE